MISLKDGRQPKTMEAYKVASNEQRVESVRQYVLMAKVLLRSHTEDLNLIEAYTISYWLKWDGQVASWSSFVSKTSGGGPKGDNSHTWIGKDKVWNYENQPKSQTHAVTKIPLGNEWIHLTVTHNGNKTVPFYINGAADDATNGLSTVRSNGVNVRAGDDGKGNKGAGAIDELVIFQRELTAKEII